MGRSARPSSALLVVVAVMLGGCGELGLDSDSAATAPAAIPGGELRVGLPTDAQIEWDPRTTDPDVLRTIGPAVMATVMRPDPAGASPAPWLAESVTADTSGRTWTITLRPGLVFADGAPLTARDIAFTLAEGASDPVLGTRFGVDGDGPFFTSADAVDDRTVLVQLRRANLALDRLVLAAPEFGCVRADYAGLTREEYLARPVSCGPFAIAPEKTTSATVRLVRNQSYVDAASVLPDAVVLSADAAFTADAQVLVDDTSGSASVASGRSAVTSPPGVTALLVMRSTRPTSDANLRQALRAAIDPDVLVAAVEGAVPASAGLTPVGWPAAIPVPVPGDRPDIARTAVALVPEDNRAVDLLVRRDDPVASTRADAIAASARAVGLKVSVRARSDKVYERALADGAFQAALLDVAPTVAHAAEVSRQWAWTAGFSGGWSSSAGERAYPGQLGTPQQSAEATARFEDVMRRGVFVVPLASDVHRVLVSQGVQGVVVGPEGSLPLDQVVVVETAPPTANSIGPTDP